MYVYVCVGSLDEETDFQRTIFPGQETRRCRATFEKPTKTRSSEYMSLMHHVLSTEDREGSVIEKRASTLSGVMVNAINTLRLWLSQERRRVRQLEQGHKLKNLPCLVCF